MMTRSLSIGTQVRIWASIAKPGPSASAVTVLIRVGVATSLTDLDLATPGAILAIQGMHGGRSLTSMGKIHEQIVVLTRLETLRRMRRDQFADRVTAPDKTSQFANRQRSDPVRWGP
jgi:hypothetical protein